MTYDTTTANTDGALVQSGSKIESSDANQGQGEQQQTSSTPQNGATDQERTQTVDTSANHGDDEAHENSFACPSTFSDPPSASTMSITSDQETTTSKVPLNGSLIEDIDRTSGESTSSASSAPGSASSDGRNSFDDDCFVVQQQQQNNSAKHDQDNKPIQSCYNPTLDDEIRYRLDKLNALSDLINKLETQFDSFNTVFRETLKCSSHRLTTIAKTIGSKSIQHGRVYHEAKISVEQTQTDCQRACVQFEQANHDHQFAKAAIKQAELRLKQLNMSSTIPNRVCLETNNNGRTPTTSFEFSDLCRLKLDDDDDEHQYEEEAPSKEIECSEYSKNECDNHDETKGSKTNSTERKKEGLSPADSSGATIKTTAQSTRESDTDQKQYSTPGNGGEQTIAQTSDQLHADAHETGVMNAAKLSEDLNRAINRLIEAEQKRSETEKLHLDQANKLMLAQENLMKLEREHGNSIRRSQIYFDEAKQFNAKLSSLKDDIAKISCEISRAKQSYAKAFDELEQFSADLHLNSHNLKSFGVE